jgi:hypothetical protein
MGDLVQRVAAKIAPIRHGVASFGLKRVRPMAIDEMIALAAIAEVFDALATPSPAMVGAVVQQVGDPSPDDWALAELTVEAIGGPRMEGERACAELLRDWQAMLTQTRAEAGV